METVTGVETIKSMAVEPQMQRRWEEQLAGYVGASFRVTTLGMFATQSVQLVNKLMTAAILFFGAKAVIDGTLTVGELVAFNMLASRVSSPVLRLAHDLAGFPPGAAFGCASRRHPEFAARTFVPPIAGGAAADAGIDQFRACRLSLSR